MTTTPPESPGAPSDMVYDANGRPVGRLHVVKGKRSDATGLIVILTQEREQLPAPSGLVYDAEGLPVGRLHVVEDRLLDGIGLILTDQPDHETADACTHDQVIEVWLLAGFRRLCSTCGASLPEED